MATNLEKLRGLLQELFQLDQADLDFGIYRIMNTKRDEVVRFLDKDLLPQVQAAFKHYKSADKSVLQGELDKLVANITSAGMNPDESPKVKELRQRLAESAVDVTALENEVFSHLFNFFRRYYSEGDFISLRRYKEGIYAIPYEGEEVKLHWANADQYYVKSSETFRDYTFKIAGGKRVRVHLVAASTEQDNNKAAQGKERRFVLADKPLSEENGELFIRFEYRQHDGKEKQDDLNKQAIDAVLKTPGFEQWGQELGKLAPTDKRRDRTVLEKHLTQYTARNTFDYFIHKDLGGFLRRELDFYIKNEVMHLDDIEHESVPKVEQYLSQIKVIRSIAHKVIQFLEQLENFQKRLWLKKKFVIETNYCITLDRVPEELYPEIAKNDAQREEWVRLFAIDEIKKDLNGPGYSKPLKVEFLKANPFLLLDTGLFTATFKDRLLAGRDDLDQQLDGLLIHADNSQALRLMQERYREQIRLIYIDPPYNTGSDGFVYKDSYRHSSWLALMHPVLRLGRELLDPARAMFVSINDVEAARLTAVLSEVFGDENFISPIVWEKSKRGDAKLVSVSHEYILVATKDKFAAIQAGKWRRRKPGVDAVLEKYTEIRRELGDDHEAIADALRKWLNTLPKDDVRRNHLHYRCSDNRGLYFPDNFAGPDDGRDSRPRYDIRHPVTGKPCKKPSTGWRWDEETTRAALADDPPRIHFGQDETTIPCRKSYLAEVDTEPVGSVFYRDGRAGTLELEQMLGSGVIDFPKDKETVGELIEVAGGNSPVVLDFFAGSGTTGHAVLALNRGDGGRRKYILVEIGDYFGTVLKPRIQKAIYSTDWKGGKPTSVVGLSHAFKYIRLESYEDALNNLELKRTDKQGMFLDADAEMREQYILSYMLDVESRGSQSLLNVEAFRNPDEYKLRVERNGETQLVNVDLVETFNWLLGLTVKHIDVIRGVRVVEGKAPNGDRVLVLWRNIDKMDNDALDKWFQKQDYNTREMVYDVFYVNGDNNLENLRRPDQTWKVRMIEEEFKRLMFDVEDV